MKKLLILSLWALFSSAAQADQFPPLDPKHCAIHVPFGAPMFISRDNVQICRVGYFLQHDASLKIPVWVAWSLTPKHVNGCVERSNSFQPDHSLPRGSRAEMSDYAGSGYDIGHVAPNGDQSWDPQVERESFYLSNMMPQLPGLNRGIWKLLETSTRGWSAQRGHTLIIISGPIYDKNTDKRIGANRVIVAGGFYKIITDQVTGETLAFVFPHQGGLGNDLSKFQVSVSDIEKLTNIKFALPERMPRNAILPIWPVSFKAITDDKRAVCKR